MREVYCGLPWTGLHVDQHLNVYPCALSIADHNSVNNFGNLKSQTVDEIVNGKLFMKLRGSWAAGIIPNECSACKCKPGNLGGVNDLSEFEKFAEQPLNYISNRYLDVRPVNTCTLECIYCNSDWSSTIAARRGKTVIPISVSARSELFNAINFEDLKNVHLAGGEPLIIKEIGTLLKKIVASNAHPTVRVNTNLVNLNTEVFDILSSMPNVDWVVSVDSAIPAQFEYIRTGHSFDTFAHNFETIRGLPGHKIFSHSVFFLLSMFDMSYTINALTKMGVDCVTIDPIFHHELAYCNFGNDILHAVFTEIEDESRNIATLGLENVKQTILSRAKNNSMHVEQVLSYLAARDLEFATNSKIIFPKLFKELYK